MNVLRFSLARSVSISLKSFDKRFSIHRVPVRKISRSFERLRRSFCCIYSRKAEIWITLITIVWCLYALLYSVVEFDGRGMENR
jgi:hypothetical protein